MIKKIGAIFKQTTPVAGTTVATGPALEELLAKEEGDLTLKQQTIQMRLTNNIRFNTFISTDKPIYRPGDTVYFRGWVLHAHNNEPIRQDVVTEMFASYNNQGVKLQVVSPSDAVAYEQKVGLHPQYGTVSDVWKIPEGLAGGNYKIKLIYGPKNFAPAEREINIREFSNPRFKMQLEFPKKGYGAGDEATANLTVARADGGIPAGASVEATARVDGNEVFRSSGKLSDKGTFQVTFTLPKAIARGEGSLNCKIDDGSSVESIGKTIPILLQAMDIRCYAEGGELVAGLPCGLYVECFTISGDPADLTAEILEGDSPTGSPVVGRIQTVHEGRGRTVFTPQLGKAYHLRVLEPSGIIGLTALPPVVQHGCSLSTMDIVTTVAKPMGLRLGATQPGVYRISAFKKDLELGSVLVSIDVANQVKEAQLTLPQSSVADGIVRVTVYDENDLPRAERLTFRKPGKSVKIDLQADKPRYAPGDTVKLKLKVTDDKGHPTNALAGISVVDDTVLEMQEKRRQAPRLPAMALLESDVDHLDDSHVYLDSSNPNADLALDLLLGTQGWRRFAFVNPVNFLDWIEDSAKGSAPPSLLDVRRGQSVKLVNEADGTIMTDSDDYTIFQAVTPLRKTAPIHYYEVTVKQLPKREFTKGSLEDSVVVIGFAHKYLEDKDQLPGWKPHTYAVHSDDGRFFDENRMHDMNWQFGLNDTVGFGFNSITRQAFFTKNGKFMGIAGAIDLTVPLFATVGFHGRGTSVGVNWGAQPFQYNLMGRIEAIPKSKDTIERLFASSAGISPAEMAQNPAPSEMNLPETASNFSSDDDLLLEADEEEASGATAERVQVLRPAARLMVQQQQTQLADGGRKGASATNKDKQKKESAASPRSSSLTAMAPPPPAAARPPSAGRGGPVAPPRPSVASRPPAPSSPVSASFSRKSDVSEKKKISMASEQEEVSSSRRSRVLAPSSSSSLSMSPPMPYRGGARVPVPVVPQHQVVRQYAHQNPKKQKKDERSDFTETVYWAASYVCGIKQLEVQFVLSDSVTSFKVHVDVISQLGGYMNTSSLLLPSTEPFFVEFKLPIEVSAGDKVSVPVAITNDTPAELKTKLSVKSADEFSFSAGHKSKKKALITRLLVNDKKELAVPAGKSTRVYLPASVAQAFLKIPVTLSAKAPGFSDVVTRETRVVPSGFPFQLASSARVQPNGKKSHVFAIPQVAPGSMVTSLVFYPAPLGNMTKALQALVREPYGCFEQTSSVVYPMVMAQQYFLSHAGVDKNIIDKAKTHIRSGCQRLMGFEVKDRAGKPSGGFDWYGSPPANESLTAYGLLEFTDLKEVFPLEESLIPRVKDWLLSRRDGKGQFLRGSGRYGFGNAPQDVTNAYICWALTENWAPDGLDKELNHVLSLADKEKKSDPYFLSLAAMALFNAKKKEDGHRVAQQIIALQGADGCVNGGRDKRLHDSRFTSITYSYGDGLFIEATGLAVLAWLRGGDKYMKNVESAMEWLFAKCKNGSFGSTQSTIIALKAIVEYDRIKMQKEPGTISVLVDGQSLGSLRFDSTVHGALEFPSFAEALKTPGDHRVEIRMEGASNPVPYSLAIEYNALQPDDDPDCRVELATKLNNSTIEEGGSTEVQVTMRNKEKETGQPMTVAIIGLPGGLEPRHAQLRELVKSGKIDFYEVLGREVVVYLREMGPGQELQFNIDVEARIPGTYSGPASRIYLYYTNEAKHWNAPLQATIKPKTTN